jgi:hypothetical protein
LLTSHLATPTSSPHSCQKYLTAGSVKTVKKVRFRFDDLPEEHDPIKEPTRPIIKRKPWVPLLNELLITGRTKKPILNALQVLEVEEAQAEVAENYLMGALDSGATDHFMPTHYQGANHKSVLDGVRVACANNSIMIARATDTLDMPGLPTSARNCHKFDEISTPLVSVGKICDGGCFNFL